MPRRSLTWAKPELVQAERKRLDSALEKRQLGSDRLDKEIYGQGRAFTGKVIQSYNF